MKRLEHTPDETTLSDLPPVDGATDEVSEAPAKPADRANRLKKKRGTMAAGALIVTSMLLSACGGRDCTTVRQAPPPGSSNFTNNPANAPTTTYCSTDTGSSYGRGFYYIGGSYGSSSGSGGSGGSSS